MKARQYAEALYLATKDKDDAEVDRILARLVELLMARGHRSLLSEVLRELIRLTKKRASSASVVVQVCAAPDVEKYAAGIAADIAVLGAAGLARDIQYDPTQIGGYEVRALGKRIDRTHKRTLVDMYHTFVGGE
jgi:F0F1-type ATP synthase delta subunit